MPSPFVILGTPRSRTAWLAAFLSYDGWTCLHEPSVGFRRLGDLQEMLHQRKIGISDSALTLRWREILRFRPDCRIVVVHRPRQRILESARKAGVYDPVTFNRTYELLIGAMFALREQAATLNVPFGALGHYEGAAAVFRHCLDLELPEDHWRAWKDRNVQADAATVACAAQANPGWRKLYPELVA